MPVRRFCNINFQVTHFCKSQKSPFVWCKDFLPPVEKHTQPADKHLCLLCQSLVLIIVSKKSWQHIQSWVQILFSIYKIMSASTFWTSGSVILRKDIQKLPMPELFLSYIFLNGSWFWLLTTSQASYIRQRIFQCFI